jgi:RNA polymerase sigma factor CnrH
MTFLEKDPDLWRRFQAGDRDALERVYWAYVDRVEDFLWLRLRHSAATPSAEVADLVQDVFLRSFSARSRRAYDGQRPFEHYLLAIARNTLIDWARRRKWEIPTEAESLELALEAPAPAYADPWIVEIVERFLAALPPELRAVHDRRYVDGLSQRDTAAALGLSRQEVRTLEAHLRERLSSQLRSRRAAEGKDVPPSARGGFLENARPGGADQTGR